MAPWDARVRRLLGTTYPQTIAHKNACQRGDATYSDVALGQTHTGRADIAAWVNSMPRRCPTTTRFEKDLVVATDSGYAFEWVMTGTHTGSMPQMPASGKSFTIHGISIGELEGGKMRNTDYWNMVEFLTQIGMMPPPTG